MGGDVCPSNASKPKTGSPRDRYIGLTPDDLRRMAELYAEGWTCQKIADLFGCSSTNDILYSLRKLGVKMRPTSSDKIPKEKHPQIIQLYEAGQSCYDIADKFGCSKESIYQILKKLNVKMRPRNSPGKFSEDTCRKMVDLYKQGHSQESIAARFGCSGKILKRIFDEHGVERRLNNRTQFQPRFTEEDQQRMVAMYQSGKSQPEIARAFGCCNFGVFRILKKLGIEKRPVPPRHIITPEDREMIMALRSQGKSYTKIAAKIGCARETVIAVMRQLNVPVRIQGLDAYSDEDQQKIADLYKIGMSMDEIAVGFDCGRKTIILILQKHGIKVRPKGFGGQRTEKLRDRMLAMYEEGSSGTEIAAKFECSLETVASVIELATRKSQIVQRITTMPNSNAAGKPDDYPQALASESRPPLSLETLLRNFWSDKARAIDVLLLPPDIRLKIMESVEQALLYAWNTLGKR